MSDETIDWKQRAQDTLDSLDEMLETASRHEKDEAEQLGRAVMAGDESWIKEATSRAKTARVRTESIAEARILAHGMMRGLMKRK